MKAPKPASQRNVHEKPQVAKGVEGNSFAIEELLKDGLQCTELQAARKWKAQAETLLRRICLETPTVSQKLEPILSDLQSLNLERVIYRVSGPDLILDHVHRDKGVELLRLASEVMSLSATRPGDPERLKRWRAIGKACAKYRGSRINIAAVCRDLQKDKIKMPQRWLDDWKKKDLSVEQCNWFIAYQDPIAKPTIQKYVSKIGRRRIKQV